VAQHTTQAGHVVLRDGEAQAVLDALHGGAVRELRCGAVDLLRRSAPGAGADPFDLASFPMVPYVNRIAHGRLAAGMQRLQLAPNWSGDPHPLHGQGWRAPWRVVEQSVTAAVLEYEGGGDEWPWRYRARQEFRLGADGLSLQLSVLNLSRETMPAALGVHPYFPDAAGARVITDAARVWRTDASALPLEEVPVPPHWAFDAGRPAASVPLDHCFTHWSGQALITWAHHGVLLQAAGCRFLHVYVPRGGACLCLEPQTAATGAFNRSADEVAQLPSGAQLSMTVTLRLVTGAA